MTLYVHVHFRNIACSALDSLIVEGSGAQGKKRDCARKIPIVVAHLSCGEKVTESCLLSASRKCSVDREMTSKLVHFA